MSADEQRKLAAIMFTDMVGYSALSQRDEKLAQELLEEHRRLLREIFPRFHGTEIKTIGDAFLVEFGSALEAAQCAIEIQRMLAHRDADASADRQIQVKIGVHIGDVVHRDGDVYGDGVNIASRIEPVAGPGGICVSMDVERQIRNALEARFEKLAPTDLKNISVPMDLFRIVLPWERDARLKQERPTRDIRRQRSIPIGWVVAALLLLIGIAAWFLFGRSQVPRKPSAGTNLPAKSIAVLPFENLSRDPENAFFTDGVQDEILTNLAKIADLKVISRTSVMQYKSGAPRNLREIGQQLGVANLLEGSVQRAANRVRVSAQLIDTRTDAHLWAERYDRDLADVFAIQSEIASAIAGQLQAKLSPVEKNAIAQRPTADLIAFDQYSRAKTLLLSTDFIVSEIKTFSQAIDLLNNAVARDPSFHAAFCQLVYAHAQIYGTIGDRTATRLAAADAALQSAIQLQPDSPETHLARGWHLYYTRRDYKGALGELEIARRGLANDPRIVELTGYILRRQGKHEEGLRALEQAIALDPRNPYMMLQLALSYQFLRRYAQEASILDRALEVAPDDVPVAALRGVTDLYWRADPERLDHFIERLKKERPGSVGPAADAWFQLALAKRDWAAAEQALNALPAGVAWGDGSVTLNRNAGAGLVARASGDEARARQALDAARREQERTVQEQKDHGPALCALALIDAALGNKEQALQEGRRAMELMPVEKDATNGQRMTTYFALIAAWVGEKDLALEQLKAAIPLPGASTVTSYGTLKLMPFWDPLRGDPRFEEIVNSLAPKEPNK